MHHTILGNCLFYNQLKVLSFFDKSKQLFLSDSINIDRICYLVNSENTILFIPNTKIAKI